MFLLIIFISLLIYFWGLFLSNKGVLLESNLALFTLFILIHYLGCIIDIDIVNNVVTVSCNVSN
jgi:ABC-type multidrug transport system permease subunit